MAQPLPPGSSPDPHAATEARVAEVLQQLRSGVRQRSAELSVQGEAAQEARQGLLAVRSREYVQEPVTLSHRPRLGRFIVLSRKVFFHLFLKWFLRPVIEQQNGFNQAASRLLQELVEAQDRMARELRQMSVRFDEIDRRLAPTVPTVPTAPTAPPPPPESTPPAPESSPPAPRQGEPG
jgi:hypothetical protein